MDDDGDDDDLDNPASGVLFGLKKRNQKAQSYIKKYIWKHIKLDVGLGIFGLIPVPGIGLVSLIVAVAAQGPFIYKPMAADMGRVYLANPDELNEINSGIVRDITFETIALDVSAYFGNEFMKEVIGELLPELGVGALLSIVPVLGGVVALSLDALIATKMTKRVGRMVSIYYQNQGRWLNGSPKETYEVAKKTKVNFDSLRSKNSELRANLVANARNLIKMMREDIGMKRIRQLLIERKIPPDIVDEALAAF